LVVVDHGRVIFHGSTKDLLAAHQPKLIVKGSSPGDLLLLQEIAADRSFNTRIEGDRLIISAPENFAAELNRLAFERGVVLGLIQVDLPTLEESFFEMTGDEK